MANMFAELARQATTLSPIIEGKTKISVGDIIANYPDGITVTDFDMVTSTDKDGNPDTYPVFVFAEDTSRFGFGGSVFKTICENWINHFDGDIETCSKALQAGGGVKMIFAQARTKAGRSVTTIKVVG